MAVTLETRGLGIGYPGSLVCGGLDLSFEPGMVTILLGPNGCGKTTLFRTLLGVLRAKAGAVVLDGRPLDEYVRRDVARRMAYVPQVAQGYFPFTVFDVVLMGRAPYLGLFDGPGKKDEDIARRAIEQLGIGAIAERPFTAISGGQQQLALIARALSQSAPILIMDEPTANLDYGNQHRIMAQARELAAMGKTVVISSHNPDHALTYADGLVLIDEGSVIAVGEPSAVLTAEVISTMYDLPVSIGDVAGSDGSLRRVIVPERSSSG